MEQQPEIPHFWARSEEIKNMTLDEQLEVKPKKSFFFKFFVFSIVLLLLAGVYAGYQVFSKRNLVSSENINLDYSVTLNAVSGKSKDFDFSISNQNDQALLNTKVTMTYERGRGISGALDNVTRVFDMGDINPRTLISTSTNIVLFGEEGDIRKIKLNFSYQVSGSNATFNKDYELDMKIAAPLVTLELVGPTKVINDNEFIIEAKIKNIAQNDFVPSVINFEIPQGFNLVRSTTSGSLDTFDLDTLSLGEEKVYTIKGNFEDIVNESRTFRVYASAKGDMGEGSQYASARIEVMIIDNPIQVTNTLKVFSKEVKSVARGEAYVSEINIVNTSQNAVDEVIVKIDKDGVIENYNKDTNQELARINPGQKVILYIEEPGDKKDFDYAIEVFGKDKGSFDTILLYSTRLPVNVE